MKKTLRITASVFALILFFASTSDCVNAQVMIRQNGSTGLTIEKSDFSGIRVKNNLASLNQLEVATEAGNFTEISATGYTFAQETGFPKLPVMRRLIEIPVGATVDVEVISSEVKEFNLSDLGIQYRLMPAQAPVAKSSKDRPPFEINNEIYNRDHFYGKVLASAEIIGFMRGTHMARLDISPVEYNPVKGIIRVHDNVVVKVTFRNGNYAETQYLQEKTRSPFFNGLQNSMLNKLEVGNGSRENFTRYPVKYVIVSDPMFQTALQPFIDWKTRKGFTVIEAYTNQPEVGNTTSSIKNYLQGLYNAGTPEDPAPTFALFVGDVAQIPAFSQGGHVSDLYYCEYTNDHIPEMFYGRFSATNVTQLQPQIDKTLMYEQYLFPDPSFLGECVMISGVDASYAPVHGNGQINYGTTYYFNEAHGLLSHTYLYPESGSSSDAIIQNVSDGLAYGNYTAHGGSSGWSSPSFEISDIPGLQNDGKYPLLVGNCCLTSTYNTNCFGEELLRAANKGAVGYIGASNSTYWDEDFYFGVGVKNIVVNPVYDGNSDGSYDLAFHDHGEPFSDWFTTQAQMFFAGNLAVTEGSPGSMVYYWEVYCLMGDPSLMIYFGVPDAMTVSYEPLMPLQSTEFTVNTEPYAYVAISKEGVLYGSALADEDGVAVVALEPITVPGDAQVIITAQNKQPYIGSVVVASPEGPYILLQSQIVNDENANNNQLPEYSESFGFNMALKNVGNSEGAGLTVTLTCPSPYVEVKEAVESWPNIGPGEIVNLDYAFEVTAADWLPDQHPAVFTLEITDGIETWNSNFTIKLNSPDLHTESIIIDDYLNGTGNGNGRLDPGENVVISVPVNNAGHCDAPETVSHLFTNSEGIGIEFIEYQIGNIPGGGSSLNALYDVSVSPDIEIGTLVNLYFAVASGLYNASQVYTPAVGLLVEDFETGDFTAFEWVNTSTVPWSIMTSAYNGGLYSARSGAIGHSANTSLQITMDVATNDNITFARRVSTESGYDFLKFYIDGVEKGSWSGDVNWSTVSYPVTQGSRTFKWTYSKDGSATGGQDAVYIDDIFFPSGNSGGSSTEFTATAFAYPDQICSEESSQLFAFATNATGNVTYSWTPAEVLNNAEIFNPIANLTETTTFDLTVYNLLFSASAQVTVNVIPAPETPVIVQNENQLVSSATEGNQWYNRDGMIEGAVNQIFEPTVSDYYHVVTSADGCASEASNEIYMTIVGVETVIAGNSLFVYVNNSGNNLNINYSLLKSSPVRISLLNLLGQQTALLADVSQIQAGNHSLTPATNGLKPGIYFVKLQAGDFTAVRKIVLSE